MLLCLRIRDLAVIERVEIELEPGYTALTGETGAGKSILVDALTLALGGRASSELIRTGAESAEVEALFDLAGAEAAKRLLLDRELLAADETELVIRRSVSRAGKNRVWINGRLESTARLFELGRALVDIYGQHDYQTLLQPDRHRSLLDGYGGLAAPVEEYRQAYEDWRRLAAEREALNLDEEARREREELLRFRAREIEAAGLEPGEDEELRRERERLRHAGDLKETSRFGMDYLYEADAAVVAGLSRLATRLESAAVHDPRFGGPAERARESVALLEDAAGELGRLDGEIESDPERLRQVEERLEEIRRLQRKYGETVAAVLRSGAEAREELTRLDRREDRLREIEGELQAARAGAERVGLLLREARARTGERLARKVREELAALGMPGARFEVRLAPADLGPAGMETLEFYLSTNPGEEPKPLARIASGGELSRIMLALRALAVGEAEVPTLVFDEVDQGIGGAAAEAVGQRLKRLAAGHQVLCVTHLPQIAALAGHHLRVRKRQETGRTSTEVEPLSGAERVEELSRMLGGKEITAAARAHAAEMLARSEAEPAPPGRRREGGRKKFPAGANGR
jgi:DNA repair protein RecN (Recombination protein N)